jgi:hypothetical protein
MSYIAMTSHVSPRYPLNVLGDFYVEDGAGARVRRGDGASVARS